MKNLVTVILLFVSVSLFAQVPKSMHLSFKDNNATVDNVTVKINGDNVLDIININNGTVNVDYGSDFDWSSSDTYTLIVSVTDGVNFSYDITSVPFAKTSQYLAKPTIHTAHSTVENIDFDVYKILSNGVYIFISEPLESDLICDDETLINNIQYNANVSTLVELKAISNQLQSLPSIYSDNLETNYYSDGSGNFYRLSDFNYITENSKYICVFKKNND